MPDLVQLIVGGLSTGAIYALVAIGFALLWQTSQTINFAQGEFVMVPAFFVLAAMSAGLSFPLAIVAGLIVTLILFGLVFKRLLIDPLRRNGVLPLVIATIALGLFLKEGVKTFYSAQAQKFPSIVPDSLMHAGGVVFSIRDISVILVAVVAVVALQLFLGRTSTGRQMQACAQNPELARILGIPVERMILLTFAVNAALVTLASVLISPIYFAKFSNGEALGLAAFCAAIVGGYNQVRGAIVGGLLLGVLDNFMAAFVSSSYRGALPLILLVAVILFRPNGLVGRREERTV